MIDAGTVLVVCTGNVCRSPYIERRLRDELTGTGIQVNSAGTGALVGQDMEAGTRQCLQTAGADVTSFTARPLMSHLVSRADLVLTAAREHRALAVRLHPAALRTTFTLRDLADLLDGVTAEELSVTPAESSWGRQVALAAASRRGLVPARQKGIDITDPIGGPQSLFDQMAVEVDDALRPIVAALRMAPSRPPEGD